MIKTTNAQNIQAWNDATDYILSKMTDEGDFYRQHVLNNALFSLLGEVKGKTILDAGSGEGYLSRLLAKKGAKVVGIEPAEGLVNQAKKRENEEKLGIEYIQADLSTWQATESSFDIVVSNMVLMDIPDWQSAMSNCIKSLKDNGSFIFSISHPCFDFPGKWEGDKPYVQVSNYFNEYEIKNYVGLSFHRMLSTYINFLIAGGCAVSKILEPQVPPDVIKKDNLRDRNIPNFLLVQAKKVII